MQYERPPSEQQRRIIEEPNLEVPLKVVAGAGTGKTFVLAHRFAWLTLERGLPADHLLALTFTENAATEMRTRIRRLLRLNGMPPPVALWVHTFHSFAARILRENAYAAGRDPEPALVTEIEESLYLDGLLQSIFDGDFAQITALSPSVLAGLGVERPEDLRRILLRLLREAKGRGLLPDDFLAQAQEQTRQFWATIPTAAEAHALNQHDLTPLLYDRAAAGFGLPPLLDPDLPKSLTLPVRKLYFADTGRKVPTPLPDAQLLLSRAQAAELALLEAATEVYRLYLLRLEQESALDFDGQIMQAVVLLGNRELRLSEHYQDYFQYLLIDEFQDTSPNQLELVRLLARPREQAEVSLPGGGVRREDTYARLLVVGDQKQSIYGWRNARPGNIEALLPMPAGETVDGAEVFRPLTESYRLTKPLVAIANRAGHAARPSDPPLEAFNSAEGRVLYPEPFEHPYGTRYAQREEAAYIADQIARLRDSGEIADLSEAAVLLRSRSRFRALKLAFERRGLLYQAQGGVGFFEHPLARDVLAWLQLLRDPQQDMYLARLLTREPYSLSDRALYLLLTQPGDDGRKRREGSAMEIVLEFLNDLPPCGAGFLARADDGAPTGTRAGKPAPREVEELAELPTSRLQAFADDYAALRELSRQATARQVLEAVWRHCSAHVRLTPSEERATSVVRGTFEGVIEQVSGAEPVPLDDLVNTLDLYLAEDHRELPVSDQSVLGAVQVLTIHRAKGLGFEAVFLPGWNESGGSGPTYDSRWGVRGIKVAGQDPKGVICKFLDKVSGRAPGTDVGDHDDESLRLAYVGLTRGKRFLCVTRSAEKSGKPPQYPAEAYFEGVDSAPAAAPVAEEHDYLLVRPAPAPVLEPIPPRAPQVLRVSFTQLRRLEQCPRAWLLSRQAPGGWDLDRPEDSSGSAGVSPVWGGSAVSPPGNAGVSPVRGGSAVSPPGGAGVSPVQVGGASPSAGAELGTRFHRFVTAHYRGVAPEAETAGLGEAEAQRLEELIAAFRASQWVDLTEPVELEVPVNLARRVGDTLVVLGGVVDLLLPQSGRVVDFKTDRAMPPAVRADHALQMLIYRQALTTGDTPPQCLLVHARSDQMETLPLSEEELQVQVPRLESLLQSLVEYAAGKPAEVRVGKHCEWCSFREVCGV